MIIKIAKYYFSNSFDPMNVLAPKIAFEDAKKSIKSYELIRSIWNSCKNGFISINTIQTNGITELSNSVEYIKYIYKSKLHTRAMFECDVLFRARTNLEFKRAIFTLHFKLINASVSVCECVFENEKQNVWTCVFNFLKFNLFSLK